VAEQSILALLNKTFQDAVIDGGSAALPPKPTILNPPTLPDDLGQLSVGLDLSLWDTINSWWQKVKDFAGNVADDARPLAESLVFRALEYRVPRIACVLSLLGLIDYQPDPAAGGGPLRSTTLKWDRLHRLLTQPDQFALNDLRNEWQNRLFAVGVDEVNRKLMQAFFGMLLHAPVELLRLEHAGQGFSSLPRTVNNVDLVDSLKKLKDLVTSPLFIRLPPGPAPADFHELFQRFVTDSIAAKAAAPNLPAGAQATAQFDWAGPSLDQVVALLKTAALDADNPLGDGWTLGFHLSGALANQAIGLQGSPINGGWSVIPGAAAEGDIFTASIHRSNGDVLRIGAADGTHLDLNNIDLHGAIRKSSQPTGAFSIGISIPAVTFVLQCPLLSYFGVQDTSLTLQGSISTDYSAGQGLQMQGADEQGGLPLLGLKLALPVNKQLGTSGFNVAVDQLALALLTTAAGEAGRLPFRLNMTFGLSAQIGPLKATADGLGVWLGRWTDGAAAGFIPPTGIGILLDAGPITGGGFLEVKDLGHENYQFAGALALKLQWIGINALGIYEQVGGQTSFLAVLGIRFLPGIQLTFGFELTGVGGLVGINRRADSDYLRERLASGAAGNVLFCDDPVHTAPALLGDLGRFFPAEAGTFLVGPTLQISWISLVRLDVGLIIELPGPRRVLIVGSARVVIGSDDAALVRLRLDFVGGLDVPKNLIFFDASLVNSTVLGILTLTGDAAFQLHFADPASVVLSIGGFHPRFNPEQFHLRPLARVSASYSLDVGAKIWLRESAYFAFTSNTLQFGGRTEAGLEIGPIAAHGFLQLDALVQFHPFYFTVDFAAGFDLEVLDHSFCGATVDGSISGPGPLVIHAHASVTVLFLEVSHSETFRIGPAQPDHVDTLDSFVNLLAAEVTNPANTQGQGDDPLVLLNPELAHADAAGFALVSPVGSVAWTQRKAPFDTPMQRYQGQPLLGTHVARIDKLNGAALPAAQEQLEAFSPGSYLNLSDADRLNLPAFERRPAGAIFGTATSDQGPIVDAEIKVSILRLPQTRRVFVGSLSIASLGLAAALHEQLGDRGLAPALTGGAARVQIHDEAWQVYTSGGNPVTQINGRNTEGVSAVESWNYRQGVGAGALATPQHEQAVEIGPALA
jgi:hypothetical protein